MKANANKRKIFDAVDLLTEDTSAQTTAVKAENGIEQIAIDSIKAFHNHPFHLYEGERLYDMVESIREHGILNPVIAERIHMDDQTISRLINNKRDPSINSLVLICLGMHLPPEISMHLIEKSPVALNFNKNDHIWYKFALTHLSKQSMTAIEKFFQEHNVQI